MTYRQHGGATTCRAHGLRESWRRACRTGDVQHAPIARSDLRGSRPPRTVVAVVTGRSGCRRVWRVRQRSWLRTASNRVLADQRPTLLGREHHDSRSWLALLLEGGVSICRRQPMKETEVSRIITGRGIAITAFAAVCAAIVMGAAPSAASGADAPQCPKEDAYTMALGALTGPSDTELRIGVAAAAGCAAVSESKHVQIKIYNADGTLASVQNLRDVVVTAGAALVMLDRVDSGHTIDVQAQVRTGSASRTFVLGGRVAAMLRPDLVGDLRPGAVADPADARRGRRGGDRGGEGRHERHGARQPGRARSARWRARRRDGSGRRQRHGDVPGRRADDAGLDRAAGHRLGRGAGRVRHPRTTFAADHGRGDEECALAAASARSQPRRLRLFISTDTSSHRSRIRRRRRCRSSSRR